VPTYVRQQAKRITTFFHSKRGMVNHVKAVFYIVFLVLLVGTQVLAIKNFSLLLIDVTKTRAYSKFVVPRPEYLYRRIPENPLTTKYNAVGRLGLDFAQIYFPSKSFSSLINNYRDGSFDPWNRQSRYAPLVHYICSISICRLDYGIASASHLVIQIFSFFAVLVFVFWKLGLKKDLVLTVCFINIFLFLTPAGLAWMERGQFSLYIATSYLLLFLGLFKKDFLLIFFSAIFSFIKWTSFPTIFVVFLVFLISSQDRRSLKFNFMMAIEFALIILFCNLLFLKESPHFLLGLKNQETFASPDGNSLVLILPIGFVKLLPIYFIGLSGIFIKVNKKVVDWLIPLIIGAGLLLVIYPTLAYDYNIPNLFGYIPIFLYWLLLPENKTPVLLRVVMKYSLFFFILLASYSGYVNVWFHNRYMTIYLYIITATIFIFLPFVFSWKRKMLTVKHLPDD
jgi:hypothetical protein